MGTLKRYGAWVVLTLAIVVIGPTAEAQGRFWVLVNGALQYTGIVSVFNGGFAATPTTGMVLSNPSAATAATTVQMSPRMMFRGNAWDTAASQTVDFFLENLPATAATPTGTFNLGYSRNGGAVTYPLTVTSGGVVTSLSNITSAANVTVGGAANFIFTGRTLLTSPSNGGLNTTVQSGTSGVQDTFGADVTVGTCGTGTVTAGSKNVAGNITATGATACTVIFNTSPTFTNKPFCVVSPESGSIPTVVVNTTVSVTVTGLTSGATFNYICRGRI